MKRFLPYGVILLSLTVTCLLLEVALGIAQIPYRNIKQMALRRKHAPIQFDPELGWAYKPSNTSIFSPSAGRRIARYFDKNGIRVPDPEYQLDPSYPSVLFIGCSFTMGNGLPYENSVAGQFSALQKDDYQAVNLGVGAYGSDQALLTLQRFMPQFNTKVVVYTFIDDHVRRNGNSDRRMFNPKTAILYPTKPLFKLNGQGELYLAKKANEDHRRSRLIDVLRIRLEGSVGFFPPRLMELTKAIIREMKSYSESQGARFVVVNWQWTESEFQDLFTDMDVDVIHVRENAPKGWNEMRAQDHQHPNRDANHHVVQLLLEYFQENSLL